MAHKKWNMTLLKSLHYWLIDIVVCLHFGGTLHFARHAHNSITVRVVSHRNKQVETG
jgi:hypothetical protein